MTRPFTLIKANVQRKVSEEKERDKKVLLVISCYYQHRTTANDGSHLMRNSIIANIIVHIT